MCSKSYNTSKLVVSNLNISVTKQLTSLIFLPPFNGTVNNNNFYYPTLLRRVQISRETSTNITRYLYSSHSSQPREVQNLGKSEFWEKKSLDNKSLIRRFGV